MCGMTIVGHLTRWFARIMVPLYKGAAQKYSAKGWHKGFSANTLILVSLLVPVDLDAVDRHKKGH